MLDELTLRGYWVLDETMLGVTTSMSVKFRKPVPYGVELVGRGIVARETSRYFVTRTAITDREGRILAEAESNYIKLPAEKIGGRRELPRRNALPHRRRSDRRLDVEKF